MLPSLHRAHYLFSEGLGNHLSLCLSQSGLVSLSIQNTDHSWSPNLQHLILNHLLESLEASILAPDCFKKTSPSLVFIPQNWDSRERNPGRIVVDFFRRDPQGLVQSDSSLTRQTRRLSVLPQDLARNLSPKLPFLRTHPPLHNDVVAYFPLSHPTQGTNAKLQLC